MYSASILGSTFDFIIGAARFIVVLGVLVFVHELGHFFAAKLSNVYVVRLSLGWGKRMFGIKWGETDYSIAVIPIGGYVKMVGQEDMPRTEEEAAAAEPEVPDDLPPERRFNNQPALNKLAISFSGPFMNLLFAFPVLFLVFTIGMQVPIFTKLTWIGAVTEGSAAEEAGLEPGLRIVSINGDPVSKFEHIQLAGMTNEDMPLDLELEDVFGARTHAIVTPRREEGAIRSSMGIAPLDAQVVATVFPGMAAERGGMMKGDVVLSADGARIDNANMSKLIETVNASAGESLRFTVLRDGEILYLTLTPDEVSIIKGVYFDKNVVLYIDENVAGSSVAALAVGDVITDVDGSPVDEMNAEEYLGTGLYERQGAEVKLTALRSEGLLGEPKTITLTVPITRTGRIGVSFSSLVFEKYGPREAVGKSFEAFGDSVVLTLQTIYYLFAGKVSPKEMAGPIGIAVMTEKSLALGVGYYLNLVAFITINLAIINLLPIPLLDGGMIVITLIEAIRRKPIEEKHMIIVQKIGVVFIAFIFIMVMYNDALRVVRVFLGGDFLE